MQIQNASITVAHKRIEGIKKAYYNNEDILKPYFNEATVLPVPDDAPPEIPRIIIKTLHEHAQLNISSIATTFEVNFDAGYEKKWKECSQYIQKRMDSVFQFLNIMTDNQYLYVGLVVNILYDEVEKNGAKKISQVLLNSDKISNIYDVNIKYTFIENENLFVNVMLQNARMYSQSAALNIAGALKHSDEIAESIGAFIDINDRYGFNTDENYKSSSTMLEKIIDCMTNVISNKLENLIERGEY